MTPSIPDDVLKEWESANTLADLQPVIQDDEFDNTKVYYLVCEHPEHGEVRIATFYANDFLDVENFASWSVVSVDLLLEVSEKHHALSEKSGNILDKYQNVLGENGQLKDSLGKIEAFHNDTFAKSQWSKVVIGQALRIIDDDPKRARRLLEGLL